MKISREWLGDYLDLGGLPDEQIAARLTEIGHPVEATEKHGQNTVFDIEFGSNRVDAMSHLGLARELGAALDRPLKAPSPKIGQVKDTGEVKISIEASELCTRYTGLVIRGVTVGPSDPKIQKRLEAVGLRPINNLVDTTNYVMLALGHPLHAFDLRDISENTIRVRKGQPNEKIKTLDGQLRTIDEQTCVIADAKRAVAIGGVIGGENSEIRESTRDVLLECAHFAPWAVRRTARKLGIKTDASYRFERGVDPGDTVTAIATAADLIVAMAGGTRGDPVDVVAAPPKPRVVSLRAQKLSEATAGKIGIDYAADLFKRMGMNLSRTGDGIQVTLPTYRGDLAEEADLIEEALRFYGFNNIPAALPRVSTGDVRHEPVAEAEEEVRDLLVGCGLAEVATYSFIHPDHNRLFTDEPQIEISNALTENIAAMRLSMFPGLLEVVAFNRGYAQRDGGIFEVGRTYHRDGKSVRERHVASFVLFGQRASHWGDPKRMADYFDARGIIEAVAAHFHVGLDFSPASRPWLKEGNAADGRHGRTHIATAGLIDRAILQKFDIKGDVIAGEIEIEPLVASMQPWTMKKVSRYPGIPMVLSFLHPPELRYAEVVAKIRGMNVPYLQEIGVWDRFVAEGSGEVKTALGMWYQAQDRSLTQEEVLQIHQQIASRLAETLPVRVIQ